MSMYRTPIVVGDRVALSPHLDLWMAGVRYGTVTEANPHVGYTEYLVDYGEGVAQRQVWLRNDDLLGAVAGTRMGGEPGATRSTDGQGACQAHCDVHPFNDECVGFHEVREVTE